MTATATGSQRAAQQPVTFYLDASALVKRYIAESGTAWIQSVCADEANYAISLS